MWLTFDMQCYKIDTINQAADRFLEERERRAGNLSHFEPGKPTTSFCRREQVIPKELHLVPPPGGQGEVYTVHFVSGSLFP